MGSLQTRIPVSGGMRRSPLRNPEPSLFMHGIVFLELRKYAVGRFGSDVWRELVKKAGLSSVFFEASRAYPDADFGRLFGAVTEHAKATPEQTMRDFGHFVAPHLIQVFKGVINPAWRALSLIHI